VSWTAFPEIKWYYVIAYYVIAALPYILAALTIGHANDIVLRVFSYFDK